MQAILLLIRQAAKIACAILGKFAKPPIVRQGRNRRRPWKWKNIPDRLPDGNGTGAKIRREGSAGARKGRGWLKGKAQIIQEETDGII